MVREKRKHARINISFPIGCQIQGAKKPFYTVFKDISQGGVKVITDNFMKKDSRIKLEINLIDKIIRGIGKVAWCRQKPYSDAYIAGIEFMEITPAGNQALKHLLSQLNPS